MNTNSKSKSFLSHPSTVRGDRGAALLIALSLLALFVMLGVGFLEHMNLEIRSANSEIHKARAKKLAEAGVNAAIGDLGQALAKKQEYATLGEAQVYAFPTYKLLNGSGRGFCPRSFWKP